MTTTPIVHQIRLTWSTVLVGVSRNAGGDERLSTSTASTRQALVVNDGQPELEPRSLAGGCGLLLIGSHADGGEIRARVTGDKDPGYGSTSKIIAEAALCLIDVCRDTPGGIWTPASAFGNTLIPRLIDRAGMTFDLVDVGA